MFSSNSIGTLPKIDFEISFLHAQIFKNLTEGPEFKGKPTNCQEDNNTTPKKDKEAPIGVIALKLTRSKKFIENKSDQLVISNIAMQT